jgi:hypothetical protein
LGEILFFRNLFLILAISGAMLHLHAHYNYAYAQEDPDTEEEEEVEEEEEEIEDEGEDEDIDDEDDSDEADDVEEPADTGTPNKPEKNEAQKKTEQKTDPKDSEKVKELQQKVTDAKAREQSTANKMIGAAAIGAAGIGGMQFMQGMAEKKADEESAADIAAYLKTISCQVSGKPNKIARGETGTAPGFANPARAIELKSEYVTLTQKIKSAKENLGMPPGIESELIVDKSSLYDYGDGGAGGKTLSRFDTAQERLDSGAAAKKMDTGAKVAGAGILGGLVVNLAANEIFPKLGTLGTGNITGGTINNAGITGTGMSAQTGVTSDISAMIQRAEAAKNAALAAERAVTAGKGELAPLKSTVATEIGNVKIHLSNAQNAAKTVREAIPEITAKLATQQPSFERLNNQKKSTEINKLLAELKQQQEAMAQNLATAETAEVKAQNASNDASTVQIAFNGQESILSRLETEVKSASSNVTRYAGEVSKARDSITKAQTDLKKAERELADEKKKPDKDEDGAVNTDKDVPEKQQEVTTAQRELDDLILEANQSLAAAEREVAAAQQKAADAAAALKDMKSAAEKIKAAAGAAKSAADAATTASNNTTLAKGRAEKLLETISEIVESDDEKWNPEEEEEEDAGADADDDRLEELEEENEE